MQLQVLLLNVSLLLLLPQSGNSFRRVAPPRRLPTGWPISVKRMQLVVPGRSGLLQSAPSVPLRFDSDVALEKALGQLLAAAWGGSDVACVLQPPR